MAASTQYLLLIHVLAALWLTVSAFGGAVVRAAGKRATELPARVQSLRIAWRLVTIFGLPGSIVAGATGLALALVTPGWMKMGWVHASLGLWLALLATNLIYGLPRLRRTLAAAEASLAAGAPTDELKRLAAAKLPGILADLNALGVVIFVVLMVLKPF